MPTIDGIYYPDAATGSSQATWAAALAASIAAKFATPTPVSYTPVITSTTTAPTLGTGGAITGSYIVAPGGLVTANIKVVWGTSLSVGVGNYSFSLPFGVDTSFHSSSSTFGAGDIVGAAGVRDDSTAGNTAIGVANLATASTIRIALNGSLALGASSPISWAAGDRIAISVTYLRAP